jgi:hypothetical protein
MAILSSHKKYTGVVDISNNFTFCNAIFDFKQFMLGLGWTVSKSGCSGTADRLSLSGDVINSAIYMNYSTVWFVLRSPDSSRELLFYRSPYFNTQSKSTGLYIGYSQQASFSTTIGANGNAVTASNPPSAPDSVWITGYSDIYGDLYQDLLNFPLPPSILPLPDSDLLFGQSLNSGSKWYMHVIAENAAPFNFYFYISYSNGSAPQSSGLFCMDYANNQAGDNDNYIFWLMPGGLSGTEQDIFKHTKMIRSWYGKFNFVNRTDYLTSVSSNRARFLPTSPLVYSSVVNNDNYNKNYVLQSGSITDQSLQDCENNSILTFNGNIPLSVSQTVYMLPINYCKGNIYQNGKISLFNYTDLPMCYKGQSSMIMSPSKYFSETSTLNYTIPNEYILLGYNAKLAFKWDGTVSKG